MTAVSEEFVILVASRDEGIRSRIVASLGSYPREVRVIAAADSEQAVLRSEEHRPGVALICTDLGPQDAFATIQQIISRVSGVSCLLLSPTPDREHFRMALRVGARDLLVIPFSHEELFNAIDSAWEVSLAKRNVLEGIGGAGTQETRGKGVVVFSTKGGTGKTFLSVNLAAGLAASLKSVALVDLDLQFGDAAIALGLVPERTIFDLVRDYKEFDLTLLREFMSSHSSGLRLLPAPLYPDEAEQISVKDVENVLNVLTQGFDYVVVDTPPFFDDTVLAALDWADHVITVGSLDLPTIKNLKIGFTMMNLFAFAEDKLWIVMNRADSRVGIDTSEAEKHLGMKVRYSIPSSIDVPKALNSGEVLLLSKPKTPVSQQVLRIVEKLTANGSGDVATPDEAKKRVGLFRR